MTDTPKVKQLWNSSAIERLFDGSGIGFVVVGMDQRIADANATFCSMLGYDLDELCSMRVSDYTHPDDLPVTASFFAHAAAANLAQTFEKRYVRKDGSVLWCRLRSEPVLDTDGKPLYRIVMAEDITRKKLDELNLEQMAAITEASDDAIFRTDADGTIQFWSKGAERMYGYTSEEALGQHANFIAATDPALGMQDNLERARNLLVRGEVVVDPDALGRRKDGRVIDVSVLVFPIKNQDGETIAHAAVHRDISDFKQLQLQLRHSQRMETAGLVAGGIAHDFNNIITVIQGAIELLARDGASRSEVHTNAALIQRSAERATRLTRQLLAFSRKQQVKPVVIDPNAVIQESLSLLARTLGDDVRLQTALASSWNIREDRTQFEQVLLNLAVNSRHAMPRGGTLMIATRDVESDGSVPRPDGAQLLYNPAPLQPGAYVRISVSDTGCGMERSVMERIFDPFFTTKPQGEGTGLGLSVVYGMVTQVGGNISVRTAPGLGTCFDLYLPRVLDQAATPAPEAAAMAPQPGRILVVEDDDAVRALTAALLQRVGYTVFQAANPREVLDGEVESDVDLILSDVMMPDISGPEFAELWLQRHPAARFLFMSGYFDEQTFAASLRGKGLIQKPFKPSTLIEAVAAELAAIPGSS